MKHLKYIAVLFLMAYATTAFAQEKHHFQTDFPVEDFVDVMDIVTATEETERNENLEAFVDGLAEETSIEGLDFKKNMLAYTRENKSKISKGTMKLINEVMA